MRFTVMHCISTSDLKKRKKKKKKKKKKKRSLGCPYSLVLFIVSKRIPSVSF